MPIVKCPECEEDFDLDDAEKSFCLDENNEEIYYFVCPHCELNFREEEFEKVGDKSSLESGR